METFKRLLAYAKPYRRFWPGYLILSIFSVIFGVVNYALIDPLLTVLFDSDTVATSATLPEFSLTIDYFYSLFEYYLVKIIGDRSVLAGLLFVCFILIAASFLSNLTRFWSQKILVNMKTHIMKGIRRDLFNVITKLHIGYFHDQRKGDILSSVSNDVNEVQNSVAASFHIIFREPLLIIGFMAGLFYMSPKLTLVTLLTLPISALVIGGVSRKLRRGAVQTQSLLGRIISQFEEAIVSIDHWVAFILLGLIGFNMIKESREEGCETMDSSFGVKAMIPLAVATSIDALAVGVTFAFLRVNIFWAVLFIGVVTFTLSSIGVKVGNVFGVKFKSKAEFAGGLILILMGTKILLEHLGFWF